MTLKMLAIGILALLGLSSVMNPKAFRVFLGGFGALCLTLFIGFLATTEANPSSEEASNPLARIVTRALHGTRSSADLARVSQSRFGRHSEAGKVRDCRFGGNFQGSPAG